MNKTAIAIVAALGGVAAGFTGGFFLGKYLAKKAADKELETACENLKDIYTRKAETNKEPEEVITVAEDIRDDYIPESEDEEVPYDPEGYDVHDYFDQDARTDPYIIDEDEYGNNYDPNWVCCNLFYRGPGKVYDEAEKLVDIPNYCGYEPLKRIDAGEKYIYVRNEAMKIDWEIVDDRSEEDMDYLTPRNKGANHDATKQV